MPDTISLLEELKESFDWYKNNPDKVAKKPFWGFIEKNRA